MMIIYNAKTQQNFELISKAYLMQNHASSTFFKSNGLPQFDPIFGLNMHNNVRQKPMELEFLVFASICYGYLIAKNRSKLAILEVFGHFLKKFSMPDPETWYTDRL